MPDCPTCGKTCNTMQGVRIHHTKVHGDSLPNLICKGCDSDFYHPKADRAFCRDCDFRARENNPNWKDAKEAAECEICEKPFEYYPTDKEGIYCPDCVESAEEFLGTPSYELRDIERVEKECEECGEEMVVLQTTVDQGRGRFYSASCRDTWFSHEYDNPHANPYSGKWYKMRHQIYKRDDHQCVRCGRHRQEIGREPEVHHFTPIREFDDPQDAHRPDNLICLCRGCHSQAEFGVISDWELRDLME